MIASIERLEEAPGMIDGALSTPMPEAGSPSSAATGNGCPSGCRLPLDRLRSPEGSYVEYTYHWWARSGQTGCSARNSWA